MTPPYEYSTLPIEIPGGPRGFRCRRLLVLESFNVIPVSSAESAVPILENWTDSSALQVHEGDLKGESLVQLPKQHSAARHDRDLRQHLAPAIRRCADAPILSEFLNRVMLYFVSRKLENLVVAGNGTTDQISGLVTQGIPFGGTAPHAVDMVGDSITALMTLGYTPDLVILSPTDWFNMISARDANGRYIGAG